MLATHKTDGGMSIKSLLVFNLTMLGNQGWCIMTNPNTLIDRIYKAVYSPRCDFLQSSMGHIPIMFGESCVIQNSL